MSRMSQTQAREALAECRRKIDAIDRELRELLNTRTRIVEEVLRMKDLLDLPIQERDREDYVIRNVTENNPGPLPDESLRRLFECLMQEMREFQRQRRGR
jgi:chorismate mutase